MARMTPKEATAGEHLLGFMAAKEDRLPREIVLALETLAGRAFNRLQAGWPETSVHEQWPHAFGTSDPE
jgi:hypothetical protein